MNDPRAYSGDPLQEPLEVVGLVPAAGSAKRLQPFPCSKEVYPVGFAPDEQSGTPRPKVAAQYLLDKFRAARITKAFLVIKDGKWALATK